MRIPLLEWKDYDVKTGREIKEQEFLLRDRHVCLAIGINMLNMTLNRARVNGCVAI